MLVVRALSDWKAEAHSRGIEASFDKFWDIQAPSKLQTDDEDDLDFDARRPRLRSAGGSLEERCREMVDNLYDCVFCPSHHGR
eukprot:9356741-Pyramimonas_sp.AAC.1